MQAVFEGYEWHDLTTLFISDYTLANPDTLTKYKTAAQISHKALEHVTGLCKEGEKIVTICEQGDKYLEAEIAKVFKGKKIEKGWASLRTLAACTLLHGA